MLAGGGVYFGMFDQTFVNTGGPTRKPWTVAASFAGQGVLVGALLMIPILNPGILQPKLELPIWVHLQPMKELPKADVSRAAASHLAAPRMYVPIEVPKGPVRKVDTSIGDAVPQNFAMVGPGPGSGNSGPDIFSNLLPNGAPAATLKETPKPPKPIVEPHSGPLAVGGAVQAAKLIYGPKPVYPHLAVVSRVQGTVKIQAIIAPDGTIHSLQVMSGPPLLIQAAKDAVSQWRYQATMLNGRAVEVVTEIDVNFTLGN
jgi:protein TonB